jgi:hypothetical protein
MPDRCDGILRSECNGFGPCDRHHIERIRNAAATVANHEAKASVDVGNVRVLAAKSNADLTVTVNGMAWLPGDFRSFVEACNRLLKFLED